LLVAEDDHFGSALYLLQVLAKRVSLVEVADYERSTVHFVLGKGSEIVETTVVDAIFSQLSLEIFKFGISVELVYDVHHFTDTLLDQVSPFDLPQHSSQPQRRVLDFLHHSDHLHSEAQPRSSYFFIDVCFFLLRANDDQRKVELRDFKDVLY
jgi:hypothetical protein